MRTETTLEAIWPEDTCYLCGRKFLRRCRREEWGYYARGNNGRHFLFCSGECCKKFEQEEFMKDIREFAESKAARVIRMTDEGVRLREAMRRVGLTCDTTVAQTKLHRWKEIEWLREHNWEVAG